MQLGKLRVMQLELGAEVGFAMCPWYGEPLLLLPKSTPYLPRPGLSMR